MFLLFIEQEVQEDQQQEHAAERRHFRVVIRQVHRVLLRILQGHVPHVHQAQIGRHSDDHEREQQAHTEHGDDDADAQEQLFPELVPRFQYGGVDHRVVERQRDFHDRENRGDTHRRQRAGQAGMFVAPPGRAQQAQRRDDE